MVCFARQYSNYFNMWCIIIFWVPYFLISSQTFISQLYFLYMYLLGRCWFSCIPHQLIFCLLFSALGPLETQIADEILSTMWIAGTCVCLRFFLEEKGKIKGNVQWYIFLLGIQNVYRIELKQDSILVRQHTLGEILLFHFLSDRNC